MPDPWEDERREEKMKKTGNRVKQIGVELNPDETDTHCITRGKETFVPTVGTTFKMVIKSINQIY